MSISFGVHGGLRYSTIPELRHIWSEAESLGFDWISVWDHFYAADFQGFDNHEAVAAHAALACSTSRVRCGSLVYCVGFRHPGILAKAITTIDHLSDGRAELGLGAGWAEDEYRAFGIPFPSVGERLDMLEEAAECIRGLLHEGTMTFQGKHFQLDEAKLVPKPVQEALPIWIGGGGERRTLNIVARYADGWNIPYIGPETFAHKKRVLAGHCERVDRDPAEIRCAVNLGIALDDDDLRAQFGDLAEMSRPGVLMGRGQELVDNIGRYVDAGADQVNIALRGKWDPEQMALVAEAMAAYR